MEQKIRTVHVDVESGYDVRIAGGLLARCGEELYGKLGVCRAAVITDSNVAPLHLRTVENSLQCAGYEISSYVFPAGEQSKNTDTLADILEFLAESRLTRRDLVIALGGGVTGDLTGFAAGCYLRGIRYVQMPTTLLAAVDSSVGGKTAVDLPAGKNLAGLFLQPSAVLCDTDCLGTQSGKVFASGAAEVIKTAVLSGEALFSLCAEGGIRENIDEVIGRCVAFKAKIVEEDEFESGPRKLLNLGHTIGHAIELLSGYTEMHGCAVSAGMAIITRAAVRRGLCSRETSQRMEAALRYSGLPATTPYGAQALYNAALSDKKRLGDAITLVIPREIGHCELMRVPVSELQDVIAAGLETL